MPASTNASYVGRFAPPGSPNTTSTPSALRHSMMASTARIAASFLLLSGARRTTAASAAGAGSLPAAGARGNGLSRRPRGALGARELELVAAAGAQRVVELDHLATARARAHRLVGVKAVQQRRGEPDEGHDRRDQKPQKERRALDL